MCKLSHIIVYSDKKDGDEPSGDINHEQSGQYMYIILYHIFGITFCQVYNFWHNIAAVEQGDIDESSSCEGRHL